jgi:hypothetical protein
MIFLDSMSNLALPVAVCGLTGIILTTTEPKRAQTKLTKERALLRCLMDAVSDLIFINAINKVRCRVFYKEMEDDRFNSYSAPGR